MRFAKRLCVALAAMATLVFVMPEQRNGLGIKEAQAQTKQVCCWNAKRAHCVMSTVRNCNLNPGYVVAAGKCIKRRPKNTTYYSCQ